METDNVAGSPMTPQNWNLYFYVRGNPVNMNDPTGHEGEDSAKLPQSGGDPNATQQNKEQVKEEQNGNKDEENRPIEEVSPIIEALKTTGLQSTSLVPLAMNNPISESGAEISLTTIQEQTKAWEGNEAAEAEVKGLSGAGTLYKIFADVVATTAEVAKENAVRAYIASKGGEGVPLAEGIFESAGLSTAAGWSYVGAAGFAGYAVGSAVNYVLPQETKEIIGDTVLGSLQTIGLYKDLEGN